MRTIHKYELVLKIGPQVISMPSGAWILSVQIQDEKLCVWAVVESPYFVEVEFNLQWTGQPLTLDGRHYYLATVQQGGLVWHIFAQPVPFFVMPKK